MRSEQRAGEGLDKKKAQEGQGDQGGAEREWPTSHRIRDSADPAVFREGQSRAAYRGRDTYTI